MVSEEKTKSFAVSKAMVYNNYPKVCAKEGAAGIDKETIEMFNADLSGSLYKVWNRISSGSYFPPAVRTVLIPKKQGGTRPLGILYGRRPYCTGCSERLPGTHLRAII